MVIADFLNKFYQLTDIKNNYFLHIGYSTTCKANGKGNKFVKGNVQDCKFPFIYKGKQHIGCAPSAGKHGPWCATKVDSKGNYLKNNWARCNKHCKTDEGELQFSALMIYE